MEAFPKAERNLILCCATGQKEKAIVMTASENGQVLGFVVLIPHKRYGMVDYLAVSLAKIRSRGTRKLYHGTDMLAVFGKKWRCS